MIVTGATPRLHFALKVASRCNLNCQYCYVYNKGDDTWRSRPALMSQAVFEKTLERIAEHCALSGQGEVHLVFHGGEPTLLGPLRFAEYCERIRAVFRDRPRAHLYLQTNGTLLDEAWLAVITRYEITVSVSVDGPREIHDASRIDHAGRGSYDAVTRGIRMLSAAGVPITALCVIPFGADPLAIHRHLLGLGASAIQYILPDYTHDSIDFIRATYKTPCFDFLSPIMTDWWLNGDMNVQVEPFREMARILLGGISRVDYFGNRPLRFLFIEAGGEIEGLDVLRVCQNGVAATGLNVMDHAFMDVFDRSELHRMVVFDGIPLSGACEDCPESATCAGGYLPHRFSHLNGFDNRSVWCDDIYLLYQQLRAIIGISTSETRLRRAQLELEVPC